VHLGPVLPFTHSSMCVPCPILGTAQGTGKLLDSKVRSCVVFYKLSKIDIALHGVYKMKERQVFKKRETRWGHSSGGRPSAKLVQGPGSIQ
jgi:hypothetical protein